MGWKDDPIVSAPQEGLVINMTRTPGPGPAAKPWEADAIVSDQAQPGSTSRLVGQGAQGANDSIANTVGAPVDLLAAGLRKLGVNVDRPVGGSESLKSGIDYVATLPGRVSDAVSQGALTPFTEDRTSRFEPQGRSEKIAHGVGEGVGAVLATMLPAGAIAKAATPGTMTAGLAEALAAQPRTQIASGLIGGATTGATDNPYVGAAAALATPVTVAGLSRAVSPVTNSLTAQERNLVSAGEKAGLSFTPAQLTGSKTLQGIEAGMSSTPLAAGPMRKAFDAQRGQFNAAVAEKAGITANNANPETLARAFEQQGRTFTDLASRSSATLDNQFVTDVTDTARTYGRRLDANIAPVFKSFVDDLEPYVQQIAAGRSPQLVGEAYQNIRSDLTTAIRQNQSSPQLQKALGGLVNALDGAMERSTSGALAGEWKEARREYQALMTIDKAMQGGTAEARSRGDIPFGALTGAVRASDKGGFSRGRGQLNELARLGDYLANKVPNSGTPERTAYQKLIGGNGAGAALAAALAGGTVASGGSLAAAAGVAAAPYALSKFYNSAAGRAYLTNELAGRVSIPTSLGQQAVEQITQAGSGDQNVALARALRLANERNRAVAR